MWKTSRVSVAAVGILILICPPAAAVASGDVTMTEILEIPASSSVHDVADDYGVALKLFKDRPNKWGGAYADSDTLVVKVVHQSLSEAKRETTLAGVRGNVRLVASDVSLTALNSQLHAIHNVFHARGRGTAVSWGPDYKRSTVVVEAKDTTAAKSAAAPGINPMGPAVEFHTASGGPETSSRYYDTVPYYGGNAVTFLNSGMGPSRLCSTAFQMKGSDGYSYAVSAGHCYRQKSTNGAILPASIDSMRRITIDIRSEPFGQPVSPHRVMSQAGSVT